MKRLLFGVAILSWLAAPRLAEAHDPWDLIAGGAGNDDSYNTRNELVNGSIQVHDLEAHQGTLTDDDWFLVGEQPYSSYEVIVDGIAPEAQGIFLDRVDSAGAVIKSASPFSTWDSARTLRFRNVSAAEIDTYVRVNSLVCSGFICSADAKYRIQFYDTTYLIARFNNSATQITLLVVQNGGPDTVVGAARFWSSVGVLLASQTFSLAPKGAFVINTTTIAGIAGQSGSITIDHDGQHGSLSGKAVAVEAATGFTFDTPMSAKTQ
jgi:hypothetical protein